MQKQNNKTTKQEPVKSKRDFAGILGVLQLFTVASIAFSSFVVIMGTDGIVPKVMLIPQITWAVVVLVKKFIK